MLDDLSLFLALHNELNKLNNKNQSCILPSHTSPFLSVLNSLQQLKKSSQLDSSLYFFLSIFQEANIMGSPFASLAVCLAAVPPPMQPAPLQRTSG